jgi:hypothetical protein
VHLIQYLNINVPISKTQSLSVSKRDELRVGLVTDNWYSDRNVTGKHRLQKEAYSSTQKTNKKTNKQKTNKQQQQKS